MNGWKFIRTQVIYKTLEEISEKLGISKQSISGWERGERKIPQKRLEELSNWTGIPREYFVIEEVTEKDKLEIRKCRLNREIDERAIYDEEVGGRVDSGLEIAYDYNEVQIKTNDTLEKIDAVIHDTPIADSNDESSAENIIAEIDSRRRWFDRFAEIVKASADTDEELMNIFIRSMELCLSHNDNRDSEWREELKISDENSQVIELALVMNKCRRRTKRRKSKGVDVLRELGIIADNQQV